MSCGVGGGSGGPLPPLPDLIPISSSSTSTGTTMGEQRSRRSTATGKQQQQQQQQQHNKQQQQQRRSGSDNNSCCSSPPVIDSKLAVESRGVCGADAPATTAATAAAATRKPSGGEHHQRHRKLDRRRDHTEQRKHNNNHYHHHNNNNQVSGVNNGSCSSSSSGLNCDSAGSGADGSGEDNNNDQHQEEIVPPVNPRVNPIFVWVKQENSRIVDVKCEDYDKRNRILLTKTAQGWRAIPRTETAAAKRPPQDDGDPHQRRHQRKQQPPPLARSNGKIPAKVHKAHRRSSKVKRKSTAVQVDDDLQQLQIKQQQQQQKQQQQQVATTTTTNAPEENLPPQDWNDPVNIESHLPSHTILVSSRLNAIAAAAAVATTSSAQPNTVTTTTSSTTINTDQDDDDDAAAVEAADHVKVSANHCNSTPLTIECPVPKLCEPSPLDNLLAVAELEFNQQFNQGRHSDDDADDDDDDDDVEDHHHHHHHHHDNIVDDKCVDDYDENMEHLTSFINSCTAAAEAAAAAAAAEAAEQEAQVEEQHPDSDPNQEELPDCDYRDDDDDNTIAMDDILSRLEQSLRSPDTINTDINEMLTNGDDVESLDAVSTEEAAKADVSRTAEHEHRALLASSHTASTTFIAEELETDTDAIEQHKTQMMDADEEAELEQEDCPLEDEDNEMMHEVEEGIVEELPEKPCDNDKIDFEPTATTDETDLMVETPIANEEAIVSSTPDFPTDLSKKKLDDCIPTDLSVPKNKARNSPPPRPQSQSSETMQSPQPSGIPAVPPSPDIVHPPAKARSVFLETMLSVQPVKPPVSTTITDEIIAKEPLNLGKNRESASPTVTCSEEVKSKQLSEDEPVYKKFKMEDITIKTLLDAETERNKARKASEEKKATVETPKLLELLTNETELSDPVTQLKQLLSSEKIKIPDPMLIPKDRLSLVLTNPLKEIPRLLSQRPELRLPEVLDYPELLQDPNMLVITVAQLQTIIYKQSSIPKENRESPPKQRSSNNVDKKLAAAVEAKHPSQQQQTTHHNHQHDPAVSKQQNSSSKGTKERERDRESEREREVPAQRNGEKSHNQEDINAATSAMLNQMMWLPYLNQLESMNYGAANSNNMEFLKMLRTIMPPYPMIPSDTMSQMMAAHRFPGQPFPMPNFNPEIAMWQEAMLQASLLRQRSPYELFNGNKESREFSGNKASAPASLPTPPAATSRHQSSSSSSSSQQSKAKHSSSATQNTNSNYAAAKNNINPYAANVAAYNSQNASARTSSNSLNHHHQPKSSANQSASRRQATSYNGHTFMDPVSHYLSTTSKDAYHKEQYNLQKDYLSKDNYLLQKQHQLQQQQQMNDAMSQYMKQQQQQQQQVQQQQQQQQQNSSNSNNNQRSSDRSREVRERDRERDSSRDAMLQGGYKSVSCKSFASLIAGEHSGGGMTSAISSGGGANRKDTGLTVERVNSSKHYSAPMDLSAITPHSSSNPTSTLSAAAALTTLSNSHYSSMSTDHITNQPAQTTTANSYQQQQAAQLLGQHNNLYNQQQNAHHSMGKIKVKQHLVDPNQQPPKLLKNRLSEQAEHEVGSTTDMEDLAGQNKHLWHPLFGNQKSYTSPWNWSTVTATGE